MALFHETVSATANAGACSWKRVWLKIVLPTNVMLRAKLVVLLGPEGEGVGADVVGATVVIVGVEVVVGTKVVLGTAGQ